MTIEAKQVRESGLIKYAVIGRDIYDPCRWITQWMHSGGLQSFHSEGIDQDKLITNADGTPAEPPAPEQPREVETAVFRRPYGIIVMNEPTVSGCEHGIPAEQGAGHGGYTCVGFRFARGPKQIRPHAQGWIHPSVSTVVNQNGCDYFTEAIIAEFAVWRLG